MIHANHIAIKKIIITSRSREIILKIFLRYLMMFQKNYHLLSGDKIWFEKNKLIKPGEYKYAKQSDAQSQSPFSRQNHR